MRKLISLKFFSKLLLIVMLTVTITSVYESAHAMQDHVKVANYQASPSEVSAAQQCPCAPFEQHKDYDGCDTCINCACHAPLTVQSFEFNNLSIQKTKFYFSFKFLPEVYLSKFIPPQEQA